MKNAFRFLAVIALALTAWTTQAQQVKIAGYQPGEFAVKGDIESQLTTNVVSPLQSKLSRTPNSEVSIAVVGFADRIGSGAANDRIGRDRAEEVKNFLSEKFPKATITFRSEGDEQDSRMVEVSWKVVATPAPAPQLKRSLEPKTVLGISLSLCGGILFFVLTRSKKSQPAQQVLAVAQAQPAPTEPEVEMVPTEQNGKRLLVPITLQDGVWHTPFMTQTDPTKVLFRQKRRSAIETVKVCVANPFYETAIEQLIAQGTIKVQKEKGNEEVLESQRQHLGSDPHADQPDRAA